MSASPDALTQEALHQHASFVRNVAVALTGQRADAEDLEQEAWLTLLRRRPGRISELRPWFTGVLRRQLWGMRRKASRRRAELIREEELAAEDGSDPLERQRTALATVTTRMRRALELMRARFEQDGVGGESWRQSLAALAIRPEASGAPWESLVVTILGLLGLGVVFVVGTGRAAVEEARPAIVPGPLDHRVAAELELTEGVAWRDRAGQRTPIDLSLSIEIEHAVVRGKTLSIERRNVVAGEMIEGGQASSLDCEPPAFNPSAGAILEQERPPPGDGKALLPGGTPAVGSTWSIEPPDLVPFLSPRLSRDDLYEVTGFELVQGSFARGTDQWFDEEEVDGAIEASCSRADDGLLVVELQIRLDGSRDLLTLPAFEPIASDSFLEVSEMTTRTTFIGTGIFTWDELAEAMVSVEISGELHVQELLRAGFGEDDQAQRFHRKSTLEGLLRATMQARETDRGEDE